MYVVLPEPEHRPALPPQLPSDVPVPCHVALDLVLPVSCRRLLPFGVPVAVPKVAVAEHGDPPAPARKVGAARHSRVHHEPSPRPCKYPLHLAVDRGPLAPYARHEPGPRLGSERVRQAAAAPASAPITLGGAGAPRGRTGSGFRVHAGRDRRCVARPRRRCRLSRRALVRGGRRRKDVWAAAAPPAVAVRRSRSPVPAPAAEPGSVRAAGQLYAAGCARRVPGDSVGGRRAGPAWKDRATRGALRGSWWRAPTPCRAGSRASTGST